MKNNTTFYQFILDKSGSMSNVRSETLEAFNNHIQSIRNSAEKFPEQKFYASLCTFNDFIEHPVVEAPLDQFMPLHMRSYVTHGSTALLDAIGHSVHRIRTEHSKLIDKGKASVVVVIMTDGMENASRLYSFPEISRMIAQLEATDYWSFSFLGADLDAFEIGRMLNIREANTKSFYKAQMHNTLDEMSVCMESYMEAKKSGRVKKDFLK
jgi:hypothetical protein